MSVAIFLSLVVTGSMLLLLGDDDIERKSGGMFLFGALAYLIVAMISNADIIVAAFEYLRGMA